MNAWADAPGTKNSTHINIPKDRQGQNTGEIQRVTKMDRKIKRERTRDGRRSTTKKKRAT